MKKGLQETQLQKHIIRPASIPRLGQNAFGFDEGFYTYKGAHSDGETREYVLDIMIKQGVVNDAKGRKMVEGRVWAFQMMCPKCDLGLFLQDSECGGQHAT